MGFWCLHLKQTLPRKDEEGEYRRCLDCGARILWSWPDGVHVRPGLLAPPRYWEALCQSLGIAKEAEISQAVTINRLARARPAGKTTVP